MPGNGSSQKQRLILADHLNQHFTVIGYYAVYTTARCEFCYDTILLKQVHDENKFFLCDHLWIKAPKFVPEGINQGDIIKVKGRINNYIRLDGTTDYTLYPFSIKRGFLD